MDERDRRRLEEFAKEHLDASSGGAHTLDHVKRVYGLAMALGRELSANLRVLGAAALLHDVGRLQELKTGISHSILSGEMSRGILTQLGYSLDEIEQVVNTIKTHRFSENIRPTSLEGEILSDADKLDAMGAIGVYRAVVEAAFSGRGIEGFIRHAEEKLLRLRDMMYTDAAKKLAESRHCLLEGFVTQLRQEMMTDWD